MKQFVKLNTIMLLAVLTFVAGCSKDSDPTIVQCYIKKVIKTDSYPGNPDYVTTIDFVYDADNRAISLKATTNFLSSGNLLQTLSYDSKGNMVKRASLDESTEYTYNGDNRVVLEKSFDAEELYDQTGYEYNASGQLSKEQSYTFPSSGTGEPIKSSYSLYTYANTTTHNVSQKKVTSPDGLTTYSTTTYEYDDKKTPYAPSVLNVIFDHNDNNIIKETYVSSSTTEVTTHKFEYNENGFPTKDVKAYFNGETETDVYTYDCK